MTKRRLKPGIVKGFTGIMIVGGIVAVQGMAIENIWMTVSGMIPTLIGAWVFYPGE